MEIELNNNNLYYNQNEHSYNHMKLSKNPNHFHEEIKPDSAIEDGGIISSNEKKNDKKDKKNWDINTNIEKMRKMKRKSMMICLIKVKLVI